MYNIVKKQSIKSADKRRYLKGSKNSASIKM